MLTDSLQGHFSSAITDSVNLIPLALKLLLPEIGPSLLYFISYFL